jgi:hypothetical protein
LLHFPSFLRKSRMAGSLLVPNGASVEPCGGSELAALEARHRRRFVNSPSEAI